VLTLRAGLGTISSDTWSMKAKFYAVERLRTK
jgi:hypothetical protein